MSKQQSKVMRVLLTGGSGDLGFLLTKELLAQGVEVFRLDIRPPQDQAGGHYIAGSITDRSQLTSYFRSMDVIVHIAAWHGIHEVRGEKDVYDFWDVNVTGTFEMFEAAVRAQVRNIVYISSTSIDERDGVYGHTKVLGEEIARTYQARHGLNVITLRPRAFIPHWNQQTYHNFIEWAQWFWRGAVHIADVTQATQQAVNLLAHTQLDDHLVLVVDGAYEYTDADLANWDAAGEGSTFRRYYPQFYELALTHGLNPAQKPKVLDIAETQRWLGYEPQYSLRNLLLELERYGLAGPPPPADY